MAKRRRRKREVRVETVKERRISAFTRVAGATLGEYIANQAIPFPLAGIVDRLEYSFVRKSGKLYLPAGGYPDGSGVVTLFESIDPDVERIETYSGEIADVLYAKDKRNRWLTIDCVTNNRTNEHAS